jgi:hypothetical protein
MKKIKLKELDEYTMCRCSLFAKYSTESSLDEYSRRNQNNAEKIKNDIKTGKMAEFMVYNYLTENGKIATKPDLDIYDKHQKSYDADMVVGNAELHVKSHLKNDRFPVSWVFQKQDKVTSTDSENDYLCLVVMDEFAGCSLYLKSAKKATFKEPKKECLKKTKVCIYESDL